MKTYHVAPYSSKHKFYLLYEELKALHKEAVKIYFDKYMIPGLEEGHPKFNETIDNLYQDIKSNPLCKKFYKLTILDMLKTVPTILHRMDPYYTGGFLIPIQYIKRPHFPPKVWKGIGMERDDLITCKYGKIYITMGQFEGLITSLRLNRKIYNPADWYIEVEYFKVKDILGGRVCSESSSS